MIPLDLLKLTESRAPIIVSYGGPGTRKTLAQVTLPARVMSFNWELRAGSIMPWVNRSRHYNSRDWQTYSNGDRQAALELVDPVLRKLSPFQTPGPFVDLIFYDPSRPESYDAFTQDLAEFDPTRFNSVCLDSLQEYSKGVQTFSKKQQVRDWSGLTRERQTAILDQPMEGKLWGGVQERTITHFSRLKSFSQAGVFVYLIAGEEIDKAYVTDPRNQEKGAKEDPYVTKGSVWVPGKLINVIGHGVDLLLRAKHFKRMVGNDIVDSAIWASVPEPLGGGSGVFWEAKDTFGRLPDNIEPNFQLILRHLYGAEAAAAIYRGKAKPVEPAKEITA